MGVCGCRWNLLSGQQTLAGSPLEGSGFKATTAFPEAGSTPGPRGLLLSLSLSLHSTLGVEGWGKSLEALIYASGMAELL